MRRDNPKRPEESSKDFNLTEIDDFAQRLQCPEEMDVCPEDVIPDTIDSLTGFLDHDFALLVTEKENYRCDPYYFNKKQAFLTPLMRSILFDWMMEVSASFRLRRETYYLAVISVDRYLSVVANVRKEEYQLVGLAALYVAAKAEEVSVRKLCEFAQSADNGFQLSDIRRMERSLLSSLKWKLFMSSPCNLLNWLTWQWDVFLENRSSAEVLFHAQTPEAYRHFRELFQVLDLAYLDVSVLLYPHRHLAMGLLYIMVARYFQQTMVQQDLASLEMLQQQSHQVEALFSDFMLSTGLVDSLKELFPALDFLYGFLDMQFHTEQTQVLCANHEDLLSCQTHNPCNVDFITRKVRSQA